MKESLERQIGYAYRPRELGKVAISYAKDIIQPLFQEHILLNTPIDRPPLFEEKVREYAIDGRHYPVFLSSHKAHPAAFPMIEEARRVADVFNEFSSNEDGIDGGLLFLASTMFKGQSDAIVGGLRRVQPIFDSYNTEILPVVRRKDRNQYSNDEVKAATRRYINVVGQVVKNGQIPLILPEGVVESGRQKPGGAPGDIKGMVGLEPDTISTVSALIRKQGKEPVFFFMGTTGENKIYDPITEKTTLRSQLVGVKRSIPLGKPLESPIMSSVIDYPLSLFEIEQVFGGGKKLDPATLDYVVGCLIARLLPYHERGIFSDDDLRDFDEAAGRRDMSTVF